MLLTVETRYYVKDLMADIEQEGTKTIDILEESLNLYFVPKHAED
jgi:hypothetical protein